MIRGIEKLIKQLSNAAGSGQTINIIISKLADTVSLQSTDDVDAIASELANKLKLELMNLV
jgi:hypothetical protein